MIRFKIPKRVQRSYYTFTMSFTKITSSLHHQWNKHQTENILTQPRLNQGNLNKSSSHKTWLKHTYVLLHFYFPIPFTTANIYDFFDNWNDAELGMPIGIYSFPTQLTQQNLVKYHLIYSLNSFNQIWFNNGSKIREISISFLQF